MRGRYKKEMRARMISVSLDSWGVSEPEKMRQTVRNLMKEKKMNT